MYIEKLLVTAGYDQFSDKTKVIDIFNSDNNCRPLAKFPVGMVQGATGGLIGNKPAICGGFMNDDGNDHRKDCFVIGQSVTKQPKMSKARGFAASVTFNENTLWVTGGLTDNVYHKDTEFVQLNGTRPGPDLPIEVAYHCLVALNSTTILLIGGARGYAVRVSSVQRPTRSFFFRS
jgi:hypothetical protein